jgi:hypothetical protein
MINSFDMATEDTDVIQPDSSMVDQIIFEAVYPIRGI